MMPLRLKLAFALVCWCLQSGGPQAGSSAQAATYADEGREAFSFGQYTEARENFEQLAKLEPNIAGVHATLAAI